MAARTRTAIKTNVQAHHGRSTEKSDLEDSLCDMALKMALQLHAFKDAQSIPTDIVITEDTTSSSLSAITDLVSVVTARVVETSGTRNRILTLKTRNWWDRHVVNPEDNLKGWPVYGMQVGSTLVYDRPADSGRSLRLRVTTIQAFSLDSTPCPIAELDTFVEYFVTANVFASLENWQSAERWRRMALGAQYDINGKIGGELANAINIDAIGDTALDVQAEPYEIPSSIQTLATLGLSITNDIDGHEDRGNTRWWF